MKGIQLLFLRKGVSFKKVEMQDKTEFSVSRVKEALSGPYVAITPCVILFMLFLLFPVGFTIVASFFEWSGIGWLGKFVGLNNYFYLILDDETFHISFSNTCILSGAAFISQVIVGFLVACLINSVRVKTFFRTALLLPLALPMVAVGITWNMIFLPRIGLMNLILGEIPFLSYLGNTIWLGNPKTALFSILVTYTWQYIGLYVVIFIAALQGVSPLFYEIAQLEGASFLQQLIYVTIPLVRRTFFICTMLCVVLTARLFPLVYVMTMGGPGSSTEILGYTIHKYAFRFFRADRAATIAFILVLYVICVTIVLTRVMRETRE